MKILVTGAAGWLARELVKTLEPAHELRLLDRVEPQAATVFAPGQAERQALPLETTWPYVRAEITDLDALRRACEGMDAVIHLAAATNGRPEQGISIMQANVIGTYAVLDAARLSGVRRVLCASSINAFGTIYFRISKRPVVYPSMPLTEAFPPEPEDPYSLSKYCNEATCAAFTRAYGLTTAAFRFAGVWTNEMYRSALGKLPTTTGWSDELYQWVHVNDIAAGLRQAMECPTLPESGVYTLGAADTRCPEATMELLRQFQPGLARNLTEPLPGRAALLSISRARKAFGYDPQIRLGV